MRPVGSVAGIPAELTSFVGRGTEFQDAASALKSERLVTLTGPGGVGKSRLAVRLARAPGPGFPDGVTYVSLAELGDPALLAGTVAGALELADQSARPQLEVLLEGLRTRRLLLVLDNCEHLIDACAELVDAVVRHCPSVVVLATSRQSLQLAGELVLVVPPMPVPDPGVTSPDLTRVDAVRLFTDRAAAVLPSFRITEANAADVARLCRQLDGLPLALELAAVRLRALSLRQIIERLDERYALLTARGPRFGPDRHETLRALIDWSHELCGEQEQLLWARVSVFADGFDLDAAEAVCTGNGIPAEHTLTLIEGLLDKSILLRQERHGVVWYRLLETIRQYGHEKLAATGESGRIRHRHRDWYLELTSRCQRAWLGPDQLRWSQRLHREHANLRTALDYCCENPDDAVLGMLMALQIKEFWLIRALTTEGRRHLGKLLQAARPDAPGRALALLTCAYLALIQGDRPAYERTLADAVAAAEREDNTSARAYILLVRGYDALITNHMAEAADHFARSAALQRTLGDLSGELWARFNHGATTAISGHPDHGRRILTGCIAEYTTRGEIFWRSWALWSLGAVEYLTGNLDSALTACRETLRFEQQVQDSSIVAFVLTVTAGIAARDGHHRRAARLFGFATSMWAAIGVSPARYAAFTGPINHDTATVVDALGTDTTTAEFTDGRAMPPQTAIQLALADEPAGISRRTPARTPLTKREIQVAELVAHGLTNRQIADTLHITPRTAGAHLDHIMTKLAVNNRVQIAAWITDTTHTQ